MLLCRLYYSQLIGTNADHVYVQVLGSHVSNMLVNVA